MKSITLLYIDRNTEICETMKRVISRQEGWSGTVVQSDAEAKTHFTNTTYDIVLFGSSISTESEQELRNFFNTTNPNTPIIQHYGGGSGLLLSEVYSTLAHKTNS